MTDDLMELIDNLQLVNPILLGHSMGGKVAMRFALEYPEKVNRLIIVDISLKAYGDRPHHRNIIEALKAVDLKQYSSRSAIDEQLKKRIPELRIRQFLMKNLHWRDKDTLEWRLNLVGIGNNLHQMFDAIQTGTIFYKPTLFVRGGLSDYILPEDYPVIRSKFPNAEIITIQKASHWVHAEAAEEFYLLSSGFLTGKPGWYDEGEQV
jgi:pimeloyl-ACP methyl ester carboxylesterase